MWLLSHSIFRRGIIPSCESSETTLLCKNATKPENNVSGTFSYLPICVRIRQCAITPLTQNIRFPSPSCLGYLISELIGNALDIGVAGIIPTGKFLVGKLTSCWSGCDFLDLPFFLACLLPASKCDAPKLVPGHRYY